jgi:DNA-binding response OmpR family regulator
MSRILVVEDEPGIALALEDDLTLESHRVTVADDGVKAIAAARAEPFDLILLDVMLPHKDGFEVCRELRRAGLRTPILMLTAKTQEAEKVMGLDMAITERVVDNQIMNLRRKVEADPANPVFIASVRGLGYRFDGLP